jgi:cytochrome c-type biogenesis protein CcmH/NrfG
MNNDSISLLVLVTVVAAAVLLRPVMRAWARRLSGEAGDVENSRDVAELRERVSELEGVAGRVSELEERVDFAERMLAQRDEAAKLPSHRTPV